MAGDLLQTSGDWDTELARLWAGAFLSYLFRARRPILPKGETEAGTWGRDYETRNPNSPCVSFLARKTLCWGFPGVPFPRAHPPKKL